MTLSDESFASGRATSPRSLRRPRTRSRGERLESSRCKTVMRGMRIGSLIVALALAGLTGAAARSAPALPPSTVSCETVILDSRFPHRSGGYRLVLGVVSVPPAYLRQVVPTGRRPWRYWRKAALVIRGDSPPVHVRVPKAWRARVRIGWGDGGGTSVRIASCPPSGPNKPGNAYSGGFRLRTRSACVPLIFTVGHRSETVRFGLGRRCPA
jgi:hypothetical protein